MVIPKTITYLKNLTKTYPKNPALSWSEKLKDRSDFWDHQVHRVDKQKYNANTFAIKTFEQFALFLSDLESLNLEQGELNSIEAKIDKLNLKKEVKNKRRYLVKKWRELEGYLIKRHKIVRNGHYQSAGAAYGAIIGCLPSFIPLALNASMFYIVLVLILGFSFGIYLGYLVGKRFDLSALKENRVLAHFSAFTKKPN